MYQIWLILDNGFKAKSHIQFRDLPDAQDFVIRNKDKMSACIYYPDNTFHDETGTEIPR